MEMLRRRTDDIRMGIVGASLIIYALLTPFLRSRRVKWGVTNAEVQQKLPGDDLLPNTAAVYTRAITIEASVAQVWSWLAQMGQGRGGMYSYEWLENLFGCDMHNADRIMPEFQNLNVGDIIWMAPRERYGGRAYNTVGAVEPNRALVLITPGYTQRRVSGDISGNGTWAFILDQLDEGTTRLIIRGRSTQNQRLFEKLIGRLTEPIEFIMEREMMLGIKERAEATPRERGLEH